jgi:hypothetical protein
MNPLFSWGAVVAALTITAEVRAADPATDRTRALDDSRSAVAIMSSNAERIRTQLQRARGARDVMQAACLDGALSRADVALRYGRDDLRAAVVAAQTADDTTLRDRATRLSWRLASSRDALKAADSCASVDVQTIRVNGTVVRVTVDPSMPVDVTDYPSR